MFVSKDLASEADRIALEKMNAVVDKAFDGIKELLNAGGPDVTWYSNRLVKRLSGMRDRDVNTLILRIVLPLFYEMAKVKHDGKIGDDAEKAFLIAEKAYDFIRKELGEEWLMMVMGRKEVS